MKIEELIQPKNIEKAVEIYSEKYIKKFDFTEKDKNDEYISRIISSIKSSYRIGYKQAMIDVYSCIQDKKEK